MNLTLHHFRKEFRYLRWRWFGFLALLGFDLAVNLEWLFPLRMGDGPLELLSLLPFAWAIFAAGVLSGCPEDCPADERHFSGTRPVAMWHFWAVRVGVFVLLVLLPVVAQNAAYLALSGRPWADVLCGLMERGMVVVGLGAWFVPVQALWARQESMGGWLLKVAVMAGCVEVLPLLTGWLDPPGRAFILPPESMIPAGLCLAVAMSLLVTAHLRMVLSFARRLCLTALIVSGTMLFTLYRPLITHPQGDQQPELVRQHAAELRITPKEAGEHIDADLSEQEHYLRQPFDMTLDAPGIHTTLRTTHASVIQSGREISLPLNRLENTPNDFHRALFNVDTTLAGLFPPETLLIRKEDSLPPNDVRPQWRSAGETSHLVGKLGPVVDESQPLRIRTDFSVQWWQRGIIADLPCVPGAEQEFEDGYRWSIRSRADHALDSEPKQGAVTVHLHLQQRTHWDRNEFIGYFLYSPERRVGWLVPDVQQTGGTRAAHTGWQRSTLTLAWKDILNHADGEDAHVDPAQLRLMVFRGREIGTTAWTWQSPELQVHSTDWNRSFGNVLGYSNLYRRDSQAFQRRFATLKPISATSTDAEVSRYLYDVLVLWARTVTEITPQAKAAFREALLPLAQHHIAHLLSLPKGYAPDMDGVFAEVIQEHLTEDQRDTVIDLMVQYPHLIEVVVNKGWAEAARRVQAPFLAAKRPLNNSQYSDLLLAWGDEASLAALLRQFRGYGREFSELAQMPAWRPRLEAVVRAERERQPLVMPGPGIGHWGIRCAADLGDAHAFDLCMRVMGNDPFPGSGSSSDIPPIPSLFSADGKQIWPNDDPVTNTLRFRHRTSADFIYVPEQLAWRVKP
jgi:hypothetical protein